MPLDPELESRVVDITDGDLGSTTLGSASVAVDEAATAHAIAAIGLDSPAVLGAPIAIYSVDLLGRVRSWNRAAEELFGWRADEVLGDQVPFTAPGEPGVPGRSLDGLDALLAGAERADGAETEYEGVELSPVHRDGHHLHVLASATVLRDEAGDPTAIVTFATDMTAKKEAALALETANHKWRHLLMNISDTVTILDRDGQVKETTGEFTDVLGYDRTSWAGRTAFDMIHPDDLGRATEIWESLLATPGGEAREVLRTRHVAGHFELIEYTGVSLLHDPIVAGVVLTTRNVTKEKQAEALLADEAEVLELIARDAPLDETLPAIARLVEYHSGGSTCILLLSGQGRALDVGAAGSVPAPLLEMVRRAPFDSTTQGPGFDLRRPTIIADYADDPRTAHVADFAAALGVRGGWAVPIIENRSEELLGIIATYLPEPKEPSDHETNVCEVASHLAAIAIERDRWQNELYHQARHHQLTGLPNRSLILETLDGAIARARERQAPLAVMFIDLDRFKVVNDSLGHAAGDKLLVRFGGRLCNLVRPGDFVGHFGADEFIVVLEDITDTEDVRFVANRLDLALSEPFALDEGEIFLSASIGAAISARGAETSETLLQHADAAMFRAKDLGRDRLEIFDHEMRTRADEQLRVDRDLRMAVERAELAVYYQPKVDLRTGRIVGAEALLRWNHPERGLVLPDQFIGVAEETGMIVRIGRWVLEEAVHQARTWVERLSGHDDFLIAVNLSARQISAPGLVDQVERVLDRYGWPPDQLALELTESVLIDDREATLDVLTELKDLGVKLAIDDFGTGFSSLNYLHRFPVDIVKIDRSFVSNLLADGEGSPVATAILHMAHALGLIAAAEGVEEPEQLAGLRALDCDLAQGFLFARPLPSEDVEHLLVSTPSW